MAVPTVVNLLGTKGSTAAGTSVIISIGFSVAVGTFVFVQLAATSNNPSTVVDSQGNVYTQLQVVGNSSPAGSIYGALITKALTTSDTITVTWGTTQQGMAALAVNVSGVANNMAQVVTSFTGTQTGSSTSPQPISFSSTHQDDTLFLFPVVTYNASGQVLNTDFTSGSVNNSYTLEGSVVSSGGTTGVGVGLCYKTVAATNPMPTQQPTYTLNVSRSWAVACGQYSAPTARGSVGANTRVGWPPASGTANYLPKPGGGTSVPHLQVGKTPFDGWPKPVITPGPREVGVQVSDGLLVAD